MRKHQLLGVSVGLVAAMTLAACGKSDDDSAAGQTAKDVQGIKDAETAVVDAYKAKNVEGVVSFYASTAVLQLPGETPTKGSDQLRYVFRQALGDPAAGLSLKSERVEVSAAGDLGYSQGTFSQTATDAATRKPATMSGSYVEVFRKTANGSWKAIEDIGTPTTPASGPAPAAAKPAPPPSAAVDTAGEADALKAVEKQWLAAWKAHDVPKIASFYTADATLMLPGAPVMSGTAAIQAGLTEAMKDPAFNLTFAGEAAAVAKSGDLGYTRGPFTQTASDPKTHKPADHKGAYVTVWRRQADGSWKAVQDIASPGYEPKPVQAAAK
ncbi:MAG TPA: SgcJ/EcaC family oxidoreductase [Caulobacteraceae bacterium]|jgi:uncharacterized protein (TIGR02246 family)|nr:SgcJ/EcaC family oxidoreductase [Caulobacteraceae bacterium]